MEEEWRTIESFPHYEVSNTGYVRRIGESKNLSPKMAKGGAWFVKISRGGGAFSKSVKTLVAEAFVPKPEDYAGTFDTPVQLTINTNEIRADKIVWRPRWFAVKFRRDLNPNTQPHYSHVPVVNRNTGVQHASILTASLHDGVLMEEVYRSCLEGRKVFPHAHRYEFLLKSDDDY